MASCELYCTAARRSLASLPAFNLHVRRLANSTTNSKNPAIVLYKVSDWPLPFFAVVLVAPVWPSGGDQLGLFAGILCPSFQAGVPYYSPGGATPSGKRVLWQVPAALGTAGSYFLSFDGRQVWHQSHHLVQHIGVN